jgi:hypothetical protein
MVLPAVLAAAAAAAQSLSSLRVRKSGSSLNLRAKRSYHLHAVVRPVADMCVVVRKVCTGGATQAEGVKRGHQLEVCDHAPCTQNWWCYSS